MLESPNQRSRCRIRNMVPPVQMVTMPSDESLHIVLFPFPGQGHFAAFLSLAGHLHRARSSATITLVSTPCNVDALRASSSAAAAPFLQFHALPFVPEEHGLPAGAESTDAVHIHHFLALFEATESPALRAAFDGFVAGAACAGADGAQVCIVVVADPFLAWTTVVARRRGARHAFFDSCGAFGSVVYHSLWNHLPHLRTGGDAFCLPDHPEVTVHRSQLPRFLLAADGTDRWSAFHRRQISLGYDTDALLVNTTEEFEPAGLRMLRRTIDVPVWPIGPLVRLPAQRSNNPDRDCDRIMRWLDGHEARSVLYISFGSQNSVRLEQMMELAAALEFTGRPFIWAIRPPVGFDNHNAGAFRADRWLPEGFEARVRANDTGLLVHGWAPQLSILAHASTGAFLSHCGWNSVLESVKQGVPIIGWPLQADQFFNCKMLGEWGACVEVARGNDEGSSVVERATLAEAVETVMGGAAKGSEVRRRMKEIQELVTGAQSECGGSSVEASEEFFASMLHGTAAGNEC
ncbi:UDP-glycosyltransferase 92A1-like [Phragmites australis]|uniref:UDP-glycosyltransferase 92A1-like n=1 Tax=Phragmites australis TaxID=29695 RepID=UPI002D797DEC|nr:UDP-glycosyltransferase 92A1-like [Phragmites australis]